MTTTTQPHHLIYEKQGFRFIRLEANHFRLQFQLANPTLHVLRLMDLPFLKLIYDLNPDIYLSSQLHIHNEHEATALLLLKNFFEDLGLPQRYTHARVVRTVLDNASVQFASHTIHLEDGSHPPGIPTDAQLLPLEQLVCTCIPTDSPHVVMVECDLVFGNEMNIPPFAEKMVGFVLFKVFSRVKDFTEKMRL